MKLERWLLNVWYGNDWLGKYLLLPLTGVFCVLAALRRWQHKRQQVKHAVPVIVVGNISVGGTGKTPLVIWLVERLREAEFKPGVVSRGYQRQAGDIGDEPTLIKQRTQVPIAIGSDRNQAIATLLQQHTCDIIIADDGLQHYRMGRDVEICVVDGQRRFGNGYCLPAGPLRESISRLQSCDFVIVNGDTMQMRGDTLVNLATDETQLLMTWGDKTVHVVTGIGNPQRFLQSLKQAGLQVIPHLYPDHHAFTGTELCFDDTHPIIMTEKDAVKCRQFAGQNAWYLPIEAVLDATLAHALLTRLQGFKHG
ncbi:tetraacyldisaccharide 4'-kinase [Thiothrix subterranea]|uniref:Tetraacyldisaccharide 4'-kinase n=1 Tax=Thiothrix subterranea TaxID=2735563 RepID=A0AA51MQD5_9GAMM|nr:tetraacyldisaccharide 4'-kinase [Thiothrix subterranea]MDQ5767395.1 tetraacyldisaccharide 4'-kinase [Thiothrix subterranea]WML88744.1 tetraacyldisaccharide 4'-kinase [Thiothrix subterranea]